MIKILRDIGAWSRLGILPWLCLIMFVLCEGVGAANTSSSPPQQQSASMTMNAVVVVASVKLFQLCLNTFNEGHQTLRAKMRELKFQFTIDFFETNPNRVVIARHLKTAWTLHNKHEKPQVEGKHTPEISVALEVITGLNERSNEVQKLKDFLNMYRGFLTCQRFAKTFFEDNLNKMKVTVGKLVKNNIITITRMDKILKNYGNDEVGDFEKVVSALQSKKLADKNDNNNGNGNDEKTQQMQQKVSCTLRSIVRRHK